MIHLRDILRGEGTFVKTPIGNKAFWDKTLKDGKGVRFNEDYTFKGFID